MDDNEKLLDTSQLLPLVEEWMAKIRTSEDDEEQKRANHDHVHECLKLTFNVQNIDCLGCGITQLCYRLTV